VVSDEEERELMCADIRFGKNWLKGAPLEIETPAMAGKRKRSQGMIKFDNSGGGSVKLTCSLKEKSTKRSALEI
jgi:hypothetical protein